MEDMTTNNPENNLFAKGQKGSADYFTGTVWVAPLLAKDSINNFSMGNVEFEPGARANWHTHPRGQVLIVTDGQGFYQEKGKPAQPIKKGDVINIPPHVEHWHGAAANNRLVHIAITNFENNEFVTWLTAVTDEEYKIVNQTK
ncbi:MAG: cupin [Bacteroidota bacterium]|nr:MAG: cupin [Bacteroidota bacterium]